MMFFHEFGGCGFRSGMFIFPIIFLLGVLFCFYRWRGGSSARDDSCKIQNQQELVDEVRSLRKEIEKLKSEQ